ncbi:FadR/GntR family transcriptional regulator [Streptomyces fuscichromogenes]|uniref:FadR/GntR family transcriptional regulator n=1 Tax=Streptomyces fuscichromogenes TaxID=1324013 RepID=UPI00167173E1|nr:GntR family transcriptional regulator [Streptomyces fuscichromogenes]
MHSPSTASLTEGPAQPHRLPDVVAGRIRELILLGELKDGERLPPLEGLLKQFGVSAPTMREALRILETEGLIKVQRGSIGGAIVHRPTPQTAAYTLAMVLRSQGTNKGDVVEALSQLEPLCATLCAGLSNRKSTVVRELRKINTASRALLDGDELAFNETMTRFHTALVQRCGSDTLKLLTGALGSICLADVRTWARSTSAHGHYPTAAERVPSIEIHERITDLIYAGDAVEVASVMTAHAKVTRKHVYGGGDLTAPVDPRTVHRSS